jgi:hypothetical protein
MAVSLRTRENGGRPPFRPDAALLDFSPDLWVGEIPPDDGSPLGFRPHPKPRNTDFRPE